MPKVSRLGGWTNRDIDLGGLTAPRLTKRPHMGPFNYVAPEPLTQYPADEPYRQHDIAYGKLSNPYFNYNSADEKLLRSRGNEWPDLIGKGVFYGKKILDVFNVPELYKGGYSSPKKEVFGTRRYDAGKVPWREFRPVSRTARGPKLDAPGSRIPVSSDVDRMPRSRERRRRYYPDEGFISLSPNLYPGKVPPGYHPGLGPGGTSNRARGGKIRGRVSYEKA